MSQVSTEIIVAHGDAGSSLSFDRPAELVEISELFYRQVFSVGIWVAVWCTALAALASLLQPPGSQIGGLVVCGICVIGVGVAAVHPESVYGRLRRCPWTLVVAGLLLGSGAATAGADNMQIFLPIAAVVGVLGIATPRRVVLVAATVAAAGLAAPHVFEGRGDVAASLTVIVPPIMFWLIVDRIIGFVLRLHQRLSATTSTIAFPRGDAAPETDAMGARSRVRGAPSPGVGKPVDLPHTEPTQTESPRLTSRQIQVIMLVCEGLRHAEIAACLGIGPQQVRRHLREARRRTGSGSTPALIAWAQASGLTPSPRRHAGGPQ